MAEVPEGMDPEFYAAVSSTEPLHPDLQPWVEEDGPLGPMLRHPLVYEVAGIRPGLVNQLYEAKKRAREEAFAEKRWHRYVFLHERPYRAKALWDLTQEIDNWSEVITLQTYCELVASVWTDSENIHQNLDVWEELLFGLEDDLPRLLLMDEEEREVYRGLPDRVTVYRGCVSDLNEDGLSWTLDREKAAWFARRAALLAGVEDTDVDSRPVVLVGSLPKDDVVAYFAGRGESEIVVAHHAEVQVERAEEP